MLKHYLSSALRHFAKHKVTTAINVASLIIGFVCFLAAHWVVASFKSSDRHFPNADRIYAITERMSVGGDEISVPRAGGLAAKHLRADFPQLEAVARITFAEETPVMVDKSRSVTQVAYADREFLDVFALPFIAGNRATALKEPRGVIVTEEIAQRWFGQSQNVLGRRVLLHGDEELAITGVIGALKQPSHMGNGPIKLVNFDMLVSMDTLDAAAQRNPSMRGSRRPLERWQISPAFTYVVLPKNGSLTAQSLIDQLPSFAARHIPKDSCACSFGLLPIAELSMSGLNTMLGTGKTGISSAALIYLLGGLVLLIACLNYANLASAQAAVRAKEIGLRRAIGAGRAQVMVQHLVEAVLQSVLALLIAGSVVAFAIFILNQPGIEFTIRFALRTTSFWIVLTFALFGVIAAAGGYPALLLSKVKPVQALRTGRIKTTTSSASSLLVGSQFVAASFLLIGILVMKQQNDAVSRSALETASDPIVVVTNNLEMEGVKFELLKTQLLSQAHVRAVSGALFAPWGNAGCNQEIVSTDPMPSARRWTVCGSNISHDFFATVGLQPLAGRLLDRDHANDSPSASREPGEAIRNIVIDRALAEQYGWIRPQDAIGQTVHMLQWNDNSKPPEPLQVVGVVENRLLAPVGYGATSYLYLLTPNMASRPIVRISKADIPAAIKELETTWKTLAPSGALKWRFADEMLNDSYSIFVAVSRFLTIVASIAFIVAVLGLIGMSVHVISRRTHEIGVRKALGASVRQVLALLMKDFSRPILIANMLAWPLAFVAMQVYLSIFTQRVGLTPSPFVISLFVALAIASLAVVVQATKAARMSPAKVLRHE